MKILIIGAHADDLETGMGGTALLLKQRGHDIISIVTTLPSVEKRYEGFVDTAPDVRKRESIEGHGPLDIVPEFFSEIETHPHINDSLRQFFGEQISRINPDIVFVHWPVDVNGDHRAISSLVLEHCLNKGINTEVFCYEVFSEVGRPQSLAYRPTHYVDITTIVAVKEGMVRSHKSQGAEKLWRGNCALHETRGKESGYPYAEAFIRLTRYGDMNQQLQDVFTPTPFLLPVGIGTHIDPTLNNFSI